MVAIGGDCGAPAWGIHISRFAELATNFQTLSTRTTNASRGLSDAYGDRSTTKDEY